MLKRIFTVSSLFKTAEKEIILLFTKDIKAERTSFVKRIFKMYSTVKNINAEFENKISQNKIIKATFITGLFHILSD